MIELLACGLIALGLGVALWRLGQDGFLPQPFHYDPSDALMDLYNPAWWANTGRAAYERWRAVYPPLSFVVLKGASLQYCYHSDAFQARSCDGRLAFVVLLAPFLLSGALAWLTFRRIDRATATQRAFALMLGLPMLDALERGNLIVLAFSLTLIAAADEGRRKGVTAAVLGLAVNLKPYLAAFLLPFALGRWRRLLGMAGVIAGVYLASYAVFGAGSPMQLLSDVGYAMRLTRHNLWNNLYFATSYNGLADALQAGAFGSAPRGPLLANLLRGLIGLVDVIALLALLQAARPGCAIPKERLAALVTAAALGTFGCSGYMEIFLLLAVFREPWRDWLSGSLILAGYALCLPVDVVLSPQPQPLVVSYFSGRVVAHELGYSFGQMVRPGLILWIETAFSWLILSQNWSRVADADRSAG